MQKADVKAITPLGAEVLEKVIISATRPLMDLEKSIFRKYLLLIQVCANRNVLLRPEIIQLLLLNYWNLMDPRRAAVLVKDLMKPNLLFYV